MNSSFERRAQQQAKHLRLKPVGSRAKQVPSKYAALPKDRPNCCKRFWHRITGEAEWWAQQSANTWCITRLFLAITKLAMFGAFVFVFLWKFNNWTVLTVVELDDLPAETVRFDLNESGLILPVITVCPNIESRRPPELFRFKTFMKEIVARQLPNIPTVCPVEALAGEIDVQELAFALLLSTPPDAPNGETTLPLPLDFCSNLASIANVERAAPAVPPEWLPETATAALVLHGVVLGPNTRSDLSVALASYLNGVLFSEPSEPIVNVTAPMLSPDDIKVTAGEDFFYRHGLYKTYFKTEFLPMKCDAQNCYGGTTPYLEILDDIRSPPNNTNLNAESKLALQHFEWYEDFVAKMVDVPAKDVYIANIVLKSNITVNVTRKSDVTVTVEEVNNSFTGFHTTTTTTVRRHHDWTFDDLPAELILPDGRTLAIALGDGTLLPTLFPRDVDPPPSVVVDPVYRNISKDATSFRRYTYNATYSYDEFYTAYTQAGTTIENSTLEAITGEVMGLVLDTHIWHLEEGAALMTKAALDEIGDNSTELIHRTMGKPAGESFWPNGTNFTVPSAPLTYFLWQDAELPLDALPGGDGSIGGYDFKGKGGNYSWDVDFTIRKDFGLAQEDLPDGRMVEKYGREDDDGEYGYASYNRYETTTLELRVESTRVYYNYSTGNKTDSDSRVMNMRMNISGARVILWHEPIIVPCAYANVEIYSQDQDTSSRVTNALSALVDSDAMALSAELKSAVQADDRVAQDSGHGVPVEPGLDGYLGEFLNVTVSDSTNLGTTARLIDRLEMDGYYGEEWECLLKDGDPAVDSNRAGGGDRHSEFDSGLDDDGYMTSGDEMDDSEDDQHNGHAHHWPNGNLHAFSGAPAKCATHVRKQSQTSLASMGKFSYSLSRSNNSRNGNPHMPEPKCFVLNENRSLKVEHAKGGLLRISWAVRASDYGSVMDGVTVAFSAYNGSEPKTFSVTPAPGSTDWGTPDERPTYNDPRTKGRDGFGRGGVGDPPDTLTVGVDSIESVQLTVVERELIDYKHGPTYAYSTNSAGGGTTVAAMWKRALTVRCDEPCTNLTTCPFAADKDAMPLGVPFATFPGGRAACAKLFGPATGAAPELHQHTGLANGVQKGLGVVKGGVGAAFGGTGGVGIAQPVLAREDLSEADAFTLYSPQIWPKKEQGRYEHAEYAGGKIYASTLLIRPRRVVVEHAGDVRPDFLDLVGFGGGLWTCVMMVFGAIWVKHTLKYEMGKVPDGQGGFKDNIRYVPALRMRFSNRYVDVANKPKRRAGVVSPYEAEAMLSKDGKSIIKSRLTGGYRVRKGYGDARDDPNEFVDDGGVKRYEAPHKTPLGASYMSTGGSLMPPSDHGVELLPGSSMRDPGASPSGGKLDSPVRQILPGSAYGADETAGAGEGAQGNWASPSKRPPALAIEERPEQEDEDAAPLALVEAPKTAPKAKKEKKKKPVVLSPLERSNALAESLRTDKLDNLDGEEARAGVAADEAGFK
jgi:hypothetical protein